MAEKPPEHKAILRAFVVVGMLFLALIFVSPLGSTATKMNLSAMPQKGSKAKRPTPSQTPKKPRADYTKFSHQTHVVTAKLACSSCHKVPSKNWKEVRKGDAAFPDVTDFPEHASCLNCHREQFFAHERPAPAICSNCHVNNSPKDTSRYLFPSLGDVNDPSKKRRALVSEFGVGFPHDKHIDVVGLNAPLPGR